jgi:hypothetical protein
MSTLEERQEAVRDVTATIMDWFPNLTGFDCERIAKLAVAACDRACNSFTPETGSEVHQFDGADRG